MSCFLVALAFASVPILFLIWSMPTDEEILEALDGRSLYDLEIARKTRGDGALLFLDCTLEGMEREGYISSYWSMPGGRYWYMTALGIQRLRFYRERSKKSRE